MIDGHDVKALRRALTQALGADRPVVVHIKTVKGKGFAPAEDGGLEGMEKWHAAKPGSDREGRSRSPAARRRRPRRSQRRRAPPQYTEVFGRALVEEARRDPRVIGITAAMAGGTGLSELARELPDQYYDVGIAEQHAVLFAAGLALEGMKPVSRDLLDLPPARLRPDHPRRLPAEAERRVLHGPRRAGRRRRADAPRRLRHLVPARDPEHGRDGAARRGDARAHAAHRARARRAGRAALPARRGGRRAAAGAPRRDPRSARGRRWPRASASRWSATAPASRLALDAAAVLRERGVDPTVCDARFAKPLDRELLHSLAAEPRAARDGRGERARRRLRLRRARAPVRLGHAPAGPAVIRFGIPDRYVTHGKPELLHEEVGLTRGAHRRARAGRAGPPRDIAQRVAMGTDIGQWAVQVLEHGLPPLPAELERGRDRAGRRLAG